MKETTAYKKHVQQVAALRQSLVGNTEPIRLKKKSISNLFRYTGHTAPDAPSLQVDLSGFNKPLALDIEKKTLDVQGLATNETIADFTLRHNLLPLTLPGLKHITIGGAIVGIGFESTSFQHGFVHDCLLEAEVLLPDGRIIVCSKLENTDLLYGLPNSFGTLGYILRAKIQLREVTPYVALTTKRYTDISQYMTAVEAVVNAGRADYIESLVYTKDELYLTTGVNIQKPESVTLMSIYGPTIFYQEISKPGLVTLRTKEYLFRYDPEWFWGLPQDPVYKFFRRLAPPSLRNSRTYSKYFKWKQKHDVKKVPQTVSTDEELIQDWLVTWQDGEALLRYALMTVDLQGKPWMPTPIVSKGTSLLYPVKPGELYFNLGSYTYAKCKEGGETYQNTKLMDTFCFAKNGLKMLYSTSFIFKEKFDSIFGGESYRVLKAKYDPHALAGQLYTKVVKTDVQ